MFSNYFFRKRKAEQEAEDVKDNINQLTKLASSAAIDYKALIRGEADTRNINLKKYRKMVLDEMDEEKEENEETNTDNEKKPVDYSKKSSHIYYLKSWYLLKFI